MVAVLRHVTQGSRHSKAAIGYSPPTLISSSSSRCTCTVVCCHGSRNTNRFAFALKSLSNARSSAILWKYEQATDFFPQTSTIFYSTLCCSPAAEFLEKQSHKLCNADFDTGRERKSVERGKPQSSLAYSAPEQPSLFIFFTFFGDCP